jgi:hypothetical protein
VVGTVTSVKPGRIDVEIDDGQRCWFEPLGGYDIEVGDVIEGNLWSLGGEELINRSKGYTMSVFMEDHT